MRAANFTQFRALLLFSLTISCSMFAIAQEAPATSHQTVPQIRIINYAGDMRALLSQLPQSFDVTIGLEVDPAQPHSYVTLEVNHPMIEDVISAITKSRPNYDWRREGRFVDIYPREHSTLFLDTVIASFEGKQMTQTEALRELFRKPQVQDALKRFNLTWAVSIPLKNDNQSVAPNIPANIDTKGSGLTVRQILHQIAFASGGQFWVLRRTGPQNNQITIEIPTR